MGKNMFLIGVGVVTGMVLHHYVVEKNGTHNAFDRAVDQGEAKLKATASQLKNSDEVAGDASTAVKDVAAKVSGKADETATKVADAADKAARKVDKAGNKTADKAEDVAAQVRQASD